MFTAVVLSLTTTANTGTDVTRLATTYVSSLLYVQALDEDQPGSKVMYKSLFEEDREYNQGKVLTIDIGV